MNPTGLPSNFPFPVPTLLTVLLVPPLAPGAAYAYLISPQYGPKNGLTGIDTAQTQIAQINDGSPDIFGVRAFNTLEGLDVPSPLFWENIGSNITFTVPLPTPVPPLHQPYPTYYEYHNGKFFASYPEALSPTGNFNSAPYPFGTVTSIGLYPPIPGVSPGTPSIPGGRNGVAGLPPGPTVHLPPPPYTVLP